MSVLLAFMPLRSAGQTAEELRHVQASDEERHVQDEEERRVQVLSEDIIQLGKRAVRDRIITEEECAGMLDFVRDSLPEETPLKIKEMEKIRDDLDTRYADMVRMAEEILDEAGVIGRRMLPDRLDILEDFVSPEEMRKAREMAAVAGVTIDMEEILKYVKPLPMKPWLMATLRLLFGRGVSQRPQRWDYYAVPQMGGVYDIIMPGGKPDDSWRYAPPMFYDPHPDKHFRR